MSIAQQVTRLHSNTSRLIWTLWPRPSSCEGVSLAPFYDLLCTAVYAARAYAQHAPTWPRVELADESTLGFEAHIGQSPASSAVRAVQGGELMLLRAIRKIVIHDMLERIKKA
nr:hypothetical protein [uncultured Rhodoferax sp.]